MYRQVISSISRIRTILDGAIDFAFGFMISKDVSLEFRIGRKNFIANVTGDRLPEVIGFHVVSHRIFVLELAATSFYCAIGLAMTI
jgi:hypothetical protein